MSNINEEKSTSLNFEEAMRELEKINAELSGENINLDTALKLYGEGVKLVRECNEKLTAAERSVKILRTDSDGAISEEKFDV